MAECSFCGEGTNLPYTCTYCSLNHCYKHKLPENHNCPNLKYANTLGPELREEHQAKPPKSHLVSFFTQKLLTLTMLFTLAQLPQVGISVARPFEFTVTLIGAFIASLGLASVLKLGYLTLKNGVDRLTRWAR